MEGGSPLPGRYARQTAFAPLGPEGQERLGRARVAVIGCGALGSHTAEHLARAGVGFLRLVDRDVVEPTNLHRQAAFTEADAAAGTPKAMALAAALSRVNSEVRLEPHAREFRFDTARELADGADLILDGTDNLPARFLLNDLALETGIPWIYAGVIGETAHAQLFLPRIGPCLRCLIPEPPPPGELETCDTAGVIGPAVGAAAAFQSALAIRFLARGWEAALAGRQVRMGVWSLRAAVSLVAADPACPTCAGGKREWLAGERAEDVRVLCGRNAVQVRAASEGDVDLAALAARLRPLGAVDERPFLVRFRSGDISLTVFPDGRTIVEGTTDPARARAIRARYIG